MSGEHQDSFWFDEFEATSAPAPDPLSDFYEDVAGKWGLPVGERVKLRLRGDALPELTGKLKLARPPDLPLDRRELLKLSLDGVEFTHRDILQWCLA